MNDQERITDLILTEKKMSGNYDIFASECVNVQLRDDFLRMFSNGHKTQTDLFKMAEHKGWYTVEQAPERKISEACTKFENALPQ